MSAVAAAAAATMMHSAAEGYAQPGHRPRLPQRDAPRLRAPIKPAFNLVGSLPWKSVMTTQQLQMHPLPDHFYPYQAHQGPPPHLAGSHPQALTQQQQQQMPDEWLAAAMNPSQSQQQALFLQDHRHYRQDVEAHPLTPTSAYSSSDLPPHPVHRRSGASPPMIKYESPSLHVNQLPLLPE